MRGFRLWMRVVLMLSVAVPALAAVPVVAKNRALVTGGSAPIRSTAGDVLGYYSLTEQWTGSDDRHLNFRVDISNNTDCTMVFNGTFFHDDKPVKFIDWGTGPVIKPRRNWSGTGPVERPRSGRRLFFENDGYLVDCPKRGDSLNRSSDRDDGLSTLERAINEALAANDEDEVPARPSRREGLIPDTNRDSKSNESPPLTPPTAVPRRSLTLADAATMVAFAPKELAIRPKPLGTPGGVDSAFALRGGRGSFQEASSANPRCMRLYAPMHGVAASLQLRYERESSGWKEVMRIVDRYKPSDQDAVLYEHASMLRMISGEPARWSEVTIKCDGLPEQIEATVTGDMPDGSELKLGQSWTVTTAQPTETTASCRVAGKDVAVVATAEFEAWRVECAIISGAISIRSRQWLVPGYGMIADESTATTDGRTTEHWNLAIPLRDGSDPLKLLDAEDFPFQPPTASTELQP